MPLSSVEAIFGRKDELSLLRKVYDSGRPEFVALYGRRRVGKTHLVRGAFQNHGGPYFEFTGIKDAPLNLQLQKFKEELEATFYEGKLLSPLKSWDEAFKILVAALQAGQKVQPGKRAVVFLDELPWMATPRSRLAQSLGHVWNTRFTKMPEIILVVCGSAASWMINNLIRSKGGLYNRVTRQIRLMPFTLPETAAFLKAGGMRFGLRAAAELYMAIGGIPHYLQQIDGQLSAAQNIARLCFTQNGYLRNEFSLLFRSLFGESDLYEKIVRALAHNRQGVSREGLLAALKAESGGGLNRKLDELEEAGFIAKLTPYTTRKKHSVYRIVDPYIYFYLRWIERAPGGVFGENGEKYWLERIGTPTHEAWGGYAFENICLTHSAKIREALGLNDIRCEIGSWNHNPPRGDKTHSGAQIDLLFDRADGVISLCEIKYSSQVFSIDKAYAQDLKRKIEVFQAVTGTRKTIQLVLIAFEGFKPNTWSEGLVDVTLDAKAIFS